MNIEWKVGSFYKSRDGQKWECLKTDLKGFFQIGLTNGEEIKSFTTDGFYMHGNPSKIDIISEWIDEPIIDWDAMPKWINWVTMDESCCWFCYENEPRELLEYWGESFGLFHQIPKEYYPKNAPTDWKQCKFKRP